VVNRDKREIKQGRIYPITNIPYEVLQTIIKEESEQLIKERNDITKKSRPEAFFYDAFYFGRGLKSDSKLNIPDKSKHPSRTELDDDHRSHLRTTYCRLKANKATDILRDEVKWKKFIYCSKVLLHGLKQPEFRERHPFITETFIKEIPKIFADIIDQYEVYFDKITALKQSLNTEITKMLEEIDGRGK
jgi:hypothetical protein